MSIAARAVSSRATSSTSLAGMAVAMALRPVKGERDELGEAVLQLGGDGGGDIAGRAGALAVGRAPEFQVGVVVHAELHGGGVDERLEALGELERDGVGPIPRLDRGRDVLPRDDAIAGHQRPPMNWASSAMRSPGATGEPTSGLVPRKASVTGALLCPPGVPPRPRAAPSSGKGPLT